MRPIMRTAAVLFLLVLSIPARAQWTALGDMPGPTRQGNALRFENARVAAVVTALSQEVIRVRITQGGDGRDHSYAVINRDFSDPGATFSIEPARSIICDSRMRAANVLCLTVGDPEHKFRDNLTNRPGKPQVRRSSVTVPSRNSPSIP